MGYQQFDLIETFDLLSDPHGENNDDEDGANKINDIYG